VLLRSWIEQARLEDRTAWVSAGRDERDPAAVLDVGGAGTTSYGSWFGLGGGADRGAGSGCWTVVERLLADLAPLADPLWLVVDDVHELGLDALRQLELLVMPCAG